MDPAKIEFLFGSLPARVDPDDPETLRILLDEGFGSPFASEDWDDEEDNEDDDEDDDEEAMEAVNRLLRRLVADQIATGSPPEVWATAQRLLGLGLDGAGVLQNLSFAFSRVMGELFGDEVDEEERELDPALYAEELDRLPLPTVGAVLEELVGAVREEPGIPLAELIPVVTARLGSGMRRKDVVGWVDEVFGMAVLGEDGPLAILAPSRVVHPGSLIGGVTLSRRLTGEEQRAGVLVLGADLALFGRAGPAELAGGGRLEPVETGGGDLGWRGPGGWLGGFEAEGLLAVTVTTGTDGARITLAAVAEPPAIDPELVGAVRAAYDREVEGPGLPVDAESIILHLILARPGVFSRPQPPLSDLTAAAGLEERGQLFAHGAEVWARGRQLEQAELVAGELPRERDRRAALAILALASQEEPDPAGLVDALDVLHDQALVSVVAEGLLGIEDAGEDLERTAAFAGALLGAGEGEDSAPALWLAALVAERRGEPLAAQALLEEALAAEPGWGPVNDRLAWYRSDRGDAAGAVALWRRVGIDPRSVPELRVVERMGRPGGGVGLGRNEPCWCGSGRKFKQCHLDRTVLPPLPERFEWLYGKPVAYMSGGGRSGRSWRSWP